MTLVMDDSISVASVALIAQGSEGADYVSRLTFDGETYSNRILRTTGSYFAVHAYPSALNIAGVV